MKTVKKITLKLVAYLSISFISLFIVNQAIFIHTHNNNGQTYIHAHPYDKSETETGNNQNTAKHSHTKAELFFFQHIEILFPLLFIAFALIYKLKEEGQLSKYTIDFKPVYISTKNGRDPPYLSFC
jgi:hypothetical protein